MAIHYVEFLGVIGGIRKAGSFDAFVRDSPLIKEAILATREGLEVCRLRGIDVKGAAPSNIRIIARTPVAVLVPLVKLQYRDPTIKQFYIENIEHGMDEISHQYADVIGEGQRLGARMPHLLGYRPYFSSVPSSI